MKEFFLFCCFKTSVVATETLDVDSIPVTKLGIALVIG